MQRRIIPLLMILMMGLTPIQSAHAFFGFGRVVFDPTNYGQNLLTAARTLQTVNNQIKQLQNEADMIVNQAPLPVRSATPARLRSEGVA